MPTPFPGAHDRYTRATWKQGVNSEMHCPAGDATGIILAASIVPVFGLANDGWDVSIEYLAGFVSGLFIFQALMMRRMYNGDYFKTVRATFFAETVSMNLVMTGMIPVMVLLASTWPDSMNPLAPTFWFRMSLATIVGGVIAFPVNYWLVKRHLKHGCMTLPGADGPAHNHGHRSPEPDGSGQPMDGMDMANMSGDHSMEHDSGSMEMNKLSPLISTILIVLSFAVLAAAVWLTAQQVPLKF